MKGIVDRFIPKHFYAEDDVESIRRASAITYLSLVCVVLGCVFVPLDLLRANYSIAINNLITTIAVGVVPFWLRARGSIFWPSQMLISIVFLSIGVLNVMSGGFSKVYLMSALMLPFLAVFLMGARFGLFWSTMVSLKIVLFLVLTKSSAAIPLGLVKATPNIEWAAALVTLSFLVTALATLYDRLKDEAFQRLRLANKALEVARQEAVEASLAKSEFLANMSHEIRTPLNAIIGYSEILKEDLEDLGEDSLLSDLDKIRNSGRHLLGLINDVLDLSKIEAGKMERFVESFSFSRWFEELTSSLGPLVEQNGNQFVVEQAGEIGEVRTDQIRLRQILNNLLSNAGKFTKEGTITLRAKLEQRGKEPWLCFEVEDDGIGVSPEQQVYLFQKFTQAELSTTKRYGGTGLGLALCEEFCALLDGKISLESELGKGSLFRVEVPARLASDEPRYFTPTSQDGLVQGHGREELVLVIDDDYSSQDMLQRFLTRNGYQVASAYNGDDGLRLAEQLNPSAILLDVCMPGLDGWDVLGKLKETPSLADIPVVFVTIVDEAQKGFALGASEYLIKPFQLQQLQAVLAKFRHTKDFSVLVIEDDDAIRELVSRTLRKEGCQATEARDGKDALQKLKRLTPDLVITDLVMPHMDGFAFLANMRKEERFSSIPVVVMTAKELTQAERTSLDGTVASILTKDAYHLQELLEALREQIHVLLHR